MRLRQVIWVVAGAALVVALAAPAFAQSDEEPTVETDANFTMEISVGFQGYAHPDEPLPVVVDLTSEELLVGRIDVTAGGNTVRTDIQVPANSEKQYVVYGAAPASRRQVTVRLDQLSVGDRAYLTRALKGQTGGDPSPRR